MGGGGRRRLTILRIEWASLIYPNHFFDVLPSSGNSLELDQCGSDLRAEKGC